MNPLHNPGHNSVVVAIDESATCLPALTWAASYARNVGADLHAVHVLHSDFGVNLVWTPALVASAPQGYVDPETDWTRARLQVIFETVAPEPSWSLHMLKGDPGQDLVHYARSAQVLVMGTREHRGMERLVIGSVSHYCLNHALCPIVVVPATVPAAVDELAANRVLTSPNGAHP